MTTNVAAGRKVVAHAPALALSNRFKMYKPEGERIVRQPKVKRDKKLEGLIRAWKTYRYPSGNDGGEGYYNALLDLTLLKTLKYSAKDVKRFSIALVEFQSESEFELKAGMFLSAVINCGKNQNYTINTRGLDGLIQKLGYENTKNVIVNGDVGDYLAYMMCCGRITVNGNVGDEIAFGLNTGSIHINGQMGELSKGIDDSGGKIYHNGKLIFPVD